MHQNVVVASTKEQHSPNHVRVPRSTIFLVLLHDNHMHLFISSPRLRHFIKRSRHFDFFSVRAMLRATCTPNGVCGLLIKVACRETALDQDQ